MTKIIDTDTDTDKERDDKVTVEENQVQSKQVQSKLTAFGFAMSKEFPSFEEETTSAMFMMLLLPVSLRLSLRPKT